MSNRPRISVLIRVSIASAILGIFFCLALLVKETPYTLTAFMFLGQPFLAVAFVLFTWKVFHELRRKKLL